MDRDLKILIIDDDQVDRLTVKRALKKTGFQCEVFESADGESGMELINKEAFDCLFLDYLLPGSDGLMMLRKIRSKGFTAPIIVITSQGDEKIAVEMMKSGATDYLVKNQINSHKISKVLTTAIQLQKAETQKREALEALQVSESRLAEAQKIAKIGNLEIDFMNQSVYWSDELYRIFGMDPKTFQPGINNHLDTVHPEDREELQALFQSENLSSIYHDFRIVSAEEKIKHANIQGYLVGGGDTPHRRIVGTIQDITDRKLAEKELVEAKIIAEESMKVKEQFLANMSHEIRNPLNAIMGFTDLVLKNAEALSEEHAKYINAIHKSGKNLLSLINDLLDFSKMNSGKLSLEEIDFDLNEVIGNAVELFKHKAAEKNIELEAHINKNVPVKLIGDPVRLNQVAINLISNAIKFTHRGYVKVEVGLIKHNHTHCLLRFDVEDTGIGIEQDQLVNIFESFTQASSDTSRKYGGTGLGLAIVKSIVELQGGTVKVVSEVNEGTRFTVSLPYTIQENKSGVEEPEADLNQIEPLKEAMKGKKILLAEDNEINQLLTSSILTDIGCKVTVVANGEDLVKKASAKPFDLIITDIEMPVMDGYAATKKLRNLKQNKASKTPILAMTGHALKKETAKCLEVGMNDFIIKPYLAQELITKMHSLIAKNQSPAENVGTPGESDNLQKETMTNQTKNHLDARHDSEAKVIETAYLKKLSGNKALYDQMINLFLSQYPENMKKLKEFFEKAKWSDLRQLSHKLKSTYNLFGAKAVKENLYQIEKECENSEMDKDKIDILIKDVVSVSEKMYSELKDELDAEWTA